MLRSYRAARPIASLMARAADRVIARYDERVLPDEPDITSRVAEAISSRFPIRTHGIPLIRTHGIPHVEWDAHVLRSGRGRAAEEKRHGADLMGVLDIAVPGYRVKKGFLVQAKKEQSLGSNKKEWERLQNQCKTMLERTTESFVFVYSPTRRIRVFAASAVLGLETRNIFDLYHKSMYTFFSTHLRSFIGDRNLDMPTIDVLDRLLPAAMDDHPDIPDRTILYATARTMD